MNPANQISSRYIQYIVDVCEVGNTFLRISFWVLPGCPLELWRVCPLLIDIQYKGNRGCWSNALPAWMALRFSRSGLQYGKLSSTMRGELCWRGTAWWEMWGCYCGYCGWEAAVKCRHRKLPWWWCPASWRLCGAKLLWVGIKAEQSMEAFWLRLWKMFFKTWRCWGVVQDVEAVPCTAIDDNCVEFC